MSERCDEYDELRRYAEALEKGQVTLERHTEDLERQLSEEKSFSYGFRLELEHTKKELAEAKRLLEFIAACCMCSHSPRMDGTRYLLFNSYYLNRLGWTDRPAKEALVAAMEIYEQDCKQDAEAAGEGK